MRYVIGVDYGTQSARAIVAEIMTGKILAEEVFVYPHGVMDRALPGGEALIGADWALADPRDYWEALVKTVRGSVRKSGVDAKEIGALAIAATACTLMPVDGDLTPLCAIKEFESHPHAYAKLWKHHRAQPYADIMTEKAKEWMPERLKDYGGRISPEWAFPKIMEVLAEDTEVYRRADRFMQFSDWLTALLTGENDVQNASIATYKAMFSRENGLPSEQYLNSISDYGMEIMYHKLRGRKIYAGEKAGCLKEDTAEKLGLFPGTTVGMAHTDAHSAALGAGAAGEGDYVFIAGTSSCGHLLSHKKVSVTGVTGVFSDGLIKGCTCYSAGQTSVGDMLEWYIKRAMPLHYKAEADKRGISAHAYLTEAASREMPGAGGVLALDWWGGNRSPLKDSGLSGLLIGLDMDTRPEDIYRALLDASVFGHRAILENYEECGLRPNSIVLCGGIANKNELYNQITADVLNREVLVSSEPQATALGAAICAASALGAKAGGFASLPEAVRRMKAGVRETVRPNPKNVILYDKIYRLYLRMHRLMGLENVEIMHNLKELREAKEWR